MSEFQEMVAERDRLREQLRSWVPDPREMCGFDDPDCPEDVRELITEACEVHDVPVPKWNPIEETETPAKAD